MRPTRSCQHGIIVRDWSQGNSDIPSLIRERCSQCSHEDAKTFGDTLIDVLCRLEIAERRVAALESRSAPEGPGCPASDRPVKRVSGPAPTAPEKTE